MVLSLRSSNVYSFLSAIVLSAIPNNRTSAHTRNGLVSGFRRQRPNKIEFKRPLFSGPFSPNYSRRNNKFLASLYAMTATTHRVPLVPNIYRRQKPVRLKQRLIVRPLGPFVFQSRRGYPLKMRCPLYRIYDYSSLMVLYILFYQRGSIVLYVIVKSYR